MNNWAGDSLPGYMDQASVGMAEPGEEGPVATGLNKQTSQGILKSWSIFNKKHPPAI